MQATVTRITDGQVYVIVRRNYVEQYLNGSHPDLKRGDKVEVKRVTNSPYLYRVREQGK